MKLASWKCLASLPGMPSRYLLCERVPWRALTMRNKSSLSSSRARIRKSSQSAKGRYLASTDGLWLATTVCIWFKVFSAPKQRSFEPVCLVSRRMTRSQRAKPVSNSAFSGTTITILGVTLSGCTSFATIIICGDCSSRLSNTLPKMRRSVVSRPFQPMTTSVIINSLIALAMPLATFKSMRETSCTDVSEAAAWRTTLPSIFWLIATRSRAWSSSCTIISG